MNQTETSPANQLWALIFIKATREGQPAREAFRRADAARRRFQALIPVAPTRTRFPAL